MNKKCTRCQAIQELELQQATIEMELPLITDEASIDEATQKLANIYKLINLAEGSPCECKENE